MPSRIIQTSELVLPAHSTMRREAPTPPDLQRPNYMGLFDSQTIFCDVFQSGPDLVMVGPPLFNLEPVIGDATFKIDGELVGEFETLALNRAQRSWIKGAAPADTVRVEFEEIAEDIRVRSDQNHLLANRRVLLGMQRNNPLQWLREWASLYSSANAVDAIIIYDLMSTHYGREDIVNVLQSVTGVDVVIVVEWPYKYGAQPIDGTKDPWDSDFGQYVAWEHALRRFLQQAHAVTVADVDEIFLAQDGRTIFEHAEEAPAGIVKFLQRDIAPLVDGIPTATVETSYADYHYFDPAAPLSTVKYAAILPKLQDRHQLLVHTIAHDYTPPSDAVLGRQFVPMKLAWLTGSYERIHPDRPATDSEFELDRALQIALERAGVTPSAPKPETPQ